MSTFHHVPHGWLPRMTAAARVAGTLALARTRNVEEDALGEQLFAELDRLKGMAMKIGQILSTVDVGLPEATRLRLARLQRGAQPLAEAEVHDIFLQAFDAPPDALFEAFAPSPVAAASIAQVHRATYQGQPVAVKLRYPGVIESIQGDFASLSAIAGLASALTAVDGAALVAELRTRMMEECDFTHEARWLSTVRPILASLGVEVPAVVAERCAPAVLTMRWIEGSPIEEALSPAIAATLLQTGWMTLFGHGFLHADPHPGNYLVEQGKLAVLDWGCVRHARPEEIEPLRALLRVVVEGDRRGFPDAVHAAGMVGSVTRFNMDEAWDQLRWLCAPYLSPRFRFDPSWALAGQRFQAPGAANQRAQSIPPLWLWLLRTMTAHHAILARHRVELCARPLLLDALQAGMS